MYSSFFLTIKFHLLLLQGLFDYGSCYSCSLSKFANCAVASLDLTSFHCFHLFLQFAFSIPKFLVHLIRFCVCFEDKFVYVSSIFYKKGKHGPYRIVCHAWNCLNFVRISLYKSLDMSHHICVQDLKQTKLMFKKDLNILNGRFILSKMSLFTCNEKYRINKNVPFLPEVLAEQYLSLSLCPT